MEKLIVTIDGPAGSGKSTIARLLAGRIGASFLDTGAMYRTVTLAAVRDGVDMTDEAALLDVVNSHDFEFKAGDGVMLVRIDGEDVTEKIRDPKVTGQAKYIASAGAVRTKLVQMQRQFAQNLDKMVTEGRDQGTVAFADAQYKFFLTADARERARRRLAELKENGYADTLEQIEAEIVARDESDRNRKVGPLCAAKDAIVVDTTKLTIEEVVEKLLGIIE